MTSEIHEQNRRSWNEATEAHNSRKRDQAAFLRDGGSTLYPEELELLGDIAGRSIAHLQCNAGQDTLSLARLCGAITGIDISDTAIAFAQGLSRDTGIPARFVRSDLLDWFDTTSDRFDIAFTSYGTIGWLEDLQRWARGVAKILQPGGKLVLMEFHPIAWSFSRTGLGGDPYFVQGPLVSENGVNDYVNAALAKSGFIAPTQPFVNPHRATSFQWTVADIVNAMVHADLRIESLREYPHSNGCEIFEGMQPLEDGRFGMPEGLPAMPLMLGVVARR